MAAVGVFGPPSLSVRGASPLDLQGGPNPAGLGRSGDSLSLQVGVTASDIHVANPQNFPDTAVGASSTKSIIVYNLGNTALNITASALALAGLNPGDFAVLLGASTCDDGAAVAPSGSCVLVVRFTPTGGAPHRRSHHHVQRPRREPLSGDVAGRGGVAPDIHAPSSQGFDPTPVVGGSSSRAITVFNTGRAPLHVSGVAISGGDTGDFRIATPMGPVGPLPLCRALALRGHHRLH